jgi:hypothetical protein
MAKFFQSTDMILGELADKVIGFNITQDTIAVPHMGYNKIDLDWSYVDPAGHEHTSDLHRTTYQMREKHWCADCHEMHSEPYGPARCRECSAAVEPKMIHVPPGTDWVAGARQATLITNEEIEIGTEFGVDMGGEEPVEFVVAVLVSWDTPPPAHGDIEHHEYTYAVYPKDEI